MAILSVKWNIYSKAALGAVLATLVLILAVALSGLLHPAAAEGQISSDEHLITIYDRGVEHSLITKEDTLRKVLADEHITLDPRDIVEPNIDEKLVARQYEVNIYRARPVTIIDGTHQVRVMSAYQTPKQIAEQAGITLRDEDEETLSLPTNLVTDGASIRMVIKRATPVRLTFYGKEEVVYTQKTTVGDFLKDKGITLESKDRISLSAETVVTANMKLEIWREGTQTQTKDEVIKFKTREIKDSNHPVGYRKVQTKGANGKQTVTYKVTVKNGKIVKRKALHRVVLKKATEAVVVVGTKIQLPAGSHKDWMGKAGISSSNYGYANAIFSQESGWNSAARNAAGYVGLGQTSESNLSRACPNWQSDPICQIKFFDGYAVSRYGSWEGAYEFKFGSGGQGGHGWW